MSPAQSLVAPTTPRIGRRDDTGRVSRPVGFKPAPRQTPGGARLSLRGTLLYPALLTVLALAAHLVGGKKDELR